MMNDTSVTLQAIVFDTGYGYNIARQIQMPEGLIWFYQCRVQLMNEAQKDRAVTRLQESNRYQIIYIEDFYQRIPVSIS